jgi:hypothetical protein
MAMMMVLQERDRDFETHFGHIFFVIFLSTQFSFNVFKTPVLSFEKIK